MFGIKDRHQDPYWEIDRPETHLADVGYTPEKIDYQAADLDIEGQRNNRQRSVALTYAQRLGGGAFQFVKDHGVITIAMTTSGYITYEVINYAFTYLPDLPSILKGTVYGLGTVQAGITGRKVSDFVNTKISSSAQYLRERFYI